MRIAELVAMIGIAGLAFFGCGNAQKPPAPTPAAKADIPLPEWAPENPSPEFLRAARVLRPMPDDLMQQAAEGQQAQEAFFGRFKLTWPATYELFGSLDDEQIKHFRETKRVYVPTKSMTRAQRTVLNRWFEVWREAMKGATQPGDEFLNDYLVFLYKQGAKENLSNVEVGFDVPEGEGIPVHLRFRVMQPDGSIKTPGITFAFYD